MWPFEEPLEEWFDEVDRRRQSRLDRPDDEESGDMMENELTAGMRRR
jgi:hypothetical protein